MTPIKLKMTAFGPYVAPVTLNFAKDLHGEKIFLIHGITGAGKTTILDAICYALYGETSGKARDAKDMRSKGVPDNVPTEIEFTFALGKKIFRIQREINYSSKRKDNKYQKRASLFDISDEEILITTRDSEIKSKITELLGFKAEQFRQVVLLPQGEFKKFLSADSDERQEVLNVLFDSEPYKKIEDALNERAKISAAAKEKLEMQCTSLEDQLSGADSKSLTDMSEKFSAAQKKSAELKKIFDSAQSELADGKNLADKFKNLETLKANIEAAQIQLAEAEKNFVTAQEKYQIHETEEPRRKELEIKIRELEDLKPTLEDLNKKISALDGKDGERQKLQTATEIFNDCDKKAKRYDERLAELETEKSKLAGADVQLEKANVTSDNAKKRDAILKEISRLKKILDMEQKKFSVVEEKLKTAQINLTRLQIVESAAYLATKLEDGKPCPVCGSLEHPAVIAEAIPSAAEIQAAQENVDRLTKEYSQQIGVVKTTATKLSSKENQLKDFDGVPDSPTAKKILEDAKKKAAELDKCQQNIEKGKKFIKDNRAMLDAANKNKNIAAEAVAKLEGEIVGLKKKIPEIYLSNKELLNVDLRTAKKDFKQLDNAWQSAQKIFHSARELKSARIATLQNEQKNFDALNAELKDKTPPDIDSLEKKYSAANEDYDKIIRETAKLETTLKTLQENLTKLADIKVKLDAAKKIADTWRSLSDVANATGKGESELKISFQRYFLSTMFNDVVVEANNRLNKMSGGRYLFQMKDAGKTKAKSAGLNLEIFDEQTGALRPIETLSGGEGFLASLSLALGLAAVVRNNLGGIKLDTIFIDEGFGSLDTETLDDAISTIKQQSGGRLVGIISHVEELKNQMPVRLEVFKTKTGSTAKFFS